MITDQLAKMEALTKRMEAAAARIETAKGKGKGGTGGAQRGDAWHEKKTSAGGTAPTRAAASARREDPDVRLLRQTPAELLLRKQRVQEML